MNNCNNAVSLTHSEILLSTVDEKSIATLTLNRPNQYNALSKQLLIALSNALDEIRKSNSIRVVIIAANGKAFSAGHDLKEMRSSEQRKFHEQLFQLCSEMMLKINRLPQPVIAQVNGVAAAAGCQLVAACDLAVASNQARFSVSGINVGLFCSTPAVALSRNLTRKQALEMLLTGDFISAEKALDYGLVNNVVQQSELNKQTYDLALKIAGKSMHAIKMGKELFYDQLALDLQSAYDCAGHTMAVNMDSADAREGIDAFISKRQAVWRDC